MSTTGAAAPDDTAVRTALQWRGLPDRLDLTVRQFRYCSGSLARKASAITR